MSTHSRTKDRIGFSSRARDPGLLIVGNNNQDFEKLDAILVTLSKRHPRLTPILCATDPMVVDWLQNNYPKVKVCALPMGMPFLADLFLNRIKARTVAVPHRDFKLPAGFRAALKRRGVNMVCLKPAGRKFSSAEIFPGAPEKDQLPANCGAEQTAQILASHVGRERHLRNGMLVGPGVEKLLRRVAVRFDNAGELSERLGAPQTIMCLGNGPSSEDPRLLEIPYDALFRTNHVWMKRGFLAQPDVVFTGLRATMRKVRGAIFGIYGQSWEKVFLVQRGWKVHHGFAEYFLTDNIGGSKQNRDDEDHWPTAGAIMISVAVALQPEKLIIAGIDMFQHGEGTYPGDASTPNDFAPAHSFDRDRQHIMHSLERYQGELVIVSEVLEREWKKYQSER